MIEKKDKLKFKKELVKNIKNKKNKIVIEKQNIINDNKKELNNFSNIINKKMDTKKEIDDNLENEIILNLDDVNIKLWHVSNIDINWNTIDENMQKKSFLLSIFSNPENSRIILAVYLFVLLTENKYQNKLKYIDHPSKDTKIVWIDTEPDNFLIIAEINNDQFEKIKKQASEKVSFSSIEEGLLKNLISYYNVNVDSNVNNSIDFFVMMILWKEWLDKQTEADRINILNYMEPYFIQKTTIKKKDI